MYTLQWFFSRFRCCAAITTIYFQNILITPERNLTPIKHTLLICSPPVPSNYESTSFFMDLFILDILYKWNHAVCAWLLSLSVILFFFFFKFIYLRGEGQRENLQVDSSLSMEGPTWGSISRPMGSMTSAETKSRSLN